MKRVLKNSSEAIQTQGLLYDRFDRVVYVKDSFLLKYSKDWIDSNAGLTEEEIRSRMTNVDGWEVTLSELLFKEELN